MKKIIQNHNNKNILRIILYLAVTFLAVYGIYNLVLGYYLKPVNIDDDTEIIISIPNNSDARIIADLLRMEELIRNEKAFLLYCQKTGKDKELKAGTYALSKNKSVQETVDIISKGISNAARLTIPEGFTVKQIGELLLDKGICSQQQWQEAINADYDYDFLPEKSSSGSRLEGFLFPDTYYITSETTAEEIIVIMLDNFKCTWDKNFASLADQARFAIKETITIASMIEEEACLDEERQRISGVIYNRLDLDMPLQIDATILYSLGEHKEVISTKDLEFDSPYNTYKNKGLPPGPISCPGKAAILAALQPEKHDYLYYVTQGGGSHYFSKTYHEHLEAIKRYR